MMKNFECGKHTIGVSDTRYYVDGIRLTRDETLLVDAAILLACAPTFADDLAYDTLRVLAHNRTKRWWSAYTSHDICMLVDYVRDTYVWSSR